MYNTDRHKTNRSKHRFPIPDEFQIGSILMLTLLFTALPQATHAATVTFNFTGHLSGVQNFLGTQGVTQISGSFSINVDAPENLDTTSSSVLSSYMALTQFTLHVSGLPDPTVVVDSTGQIDVWNNSFVNDRVDINAGITGGTITVGGATFAPDTANLLYRFNNLGVLDSTNLPPAVSVLDDLSLLVFSESMGSLIYRNVLDASDARIQFIQFDSVVMTTPVPGPGPGPLLVLGFVLAGIVFSRKIFLA